MDDDVQERAIVALSQLIFPDEDSLLEYRRAMAKVQLNRLDKAGLMVVAKTEKSQYDKDHDWMTEHYPDQWSYSPGGGQFSVFKSSTDYPADGVGETLKEALHNAVLKLSDPRYKDLPGPVLPYESGPATPPKDDSRIAQNIWLDIKQYVHAEMNDYQLEAQKIEAEIKTQLGRLVMNQR